MQTIDLVRKTANIIFVQSVIISTRISYTPFHLGVSRQPCLCQRLSSWYSAQCLLILAREDKKDLSNLHVLNWGLVHSAVNICLHNTSVNGDIECQPETTQIESLFTGLLEVY